LTHAVICDETYDPPVRALNSVLLCCQADHDFCEQVMLSIMRSCIGGPGLGYEFMLCARQLANERNALQ